MLQADERQTCQAGLTWGKLFCPASERVAISCEPHRKLEFWRIWRETVDPDWLDLPEREPLTKMSEVRLQTPYHHWIQVTGPYWHPPSEPLRVQDLEKARERIGVAIVRCRRQKQPMLEAASQLAYGSGEVAVDRIALRARRGCVMSFVQDQHGLSAELTERVAQPRRVGRIRQQCVRQDKQGTGSPRVRAVTPVSPQTDDMLAVDDGERKAELRFQLILPLPGHRPGRCGHKDIIDPAPEQHLPEDQPGLDRLPRPDIIGNQEVDPRQPKRLSKRQ